MRNIITCASYGGTGSSAITDFLKEFSSCKSMGDFEFTFIHHPDGISDLEYNLIENNNRLSTGFAIYRTEEKFKKISPIYKKYFGKKFEFHTQNYLKNLIQISWQGTSELYTENENTLRKIKRKIILKVNNKLLRSNKINNLLKIYPQYCSYIEKERFYEETKQYLNKLFDELDLEYKYQNLALDQLVPCSNINRYLNYFENLKVIVVDRDPRDLYILNKEFWNEGWIPTNINTFVEWFKIIRKHQIEEIKNEKKEQVMRIKFEDLIYNYDKSILEIINFLELKKEDHVYKKLYFNPEQSINNTRLWNKYTKYEKEMQIIIQELGDYCYN